MSAGVTIQLGPQPLDVSYNNYNESLSDEERLSPL